MTAQGFEFDHVVFGDDLVHQPREGWVGRREFSHDRGLAPRTPIPCSPCSSAYATVVPESFQRLTPEQASAVIDSDRARGATDELADVFTYLARLADVVGVDLTASALARLDRNERRFPVDHVHGRADRNALDERDG